ncbi:hypothetical protein I0D00_05505 [Pseudomonas lalucatii]|uniref:DUF4239 domain-containing protein n=1 Tax=Pseudomonas lalucatii TaxID=1424203 RepID=A0ABS5PYF7_9PSED|nr:hypothetical protein [Pseudomonas lalucatii]MBS7661404.1 hypothetical protein [Pseudomonas lalucatii]MBS7691779.1 hypothetical protein [Pseudomonas lalucatii]MBS7724108.1 hypothetical protein [Pseudomonas lalucatii]QVM87889.1 hypothetical protein I0D68_02510 [Pseudomonas lalucatii]
MYQQELLYGHNSFAITAVLFVLIILFNEVGFQIGRFVQNRTDSEVKELTGSVQASILGLLALLLGFTFSMSMQRYDDRNQALIEEANAIGTASLRVQLLPARYQQPMSELLRQYVDLRVSLGEIDLSRHAERSRYNARIKRLQGELWALAVQATNDDPRPVTSGAFVSALNQMIDSQGQRHAQLQMHVPEVVLLLLFVVFIASVGILGYSSGLSGKRIVVPTVLVSLLIALIVFIIIDLDRPKRGLIQVDQGIMQELQQRPQG